ncbi:hypothetical protein LIER_04875 [Lithospermum erythrorhizon]|uniref:Uncharacterized protein n=1 Tax=Lithospermum erythrorhizon TaxID=34254 RepID=A0AAV3NYC4_LITER
MEEVDFDEMLGERTSSFDRLKIKSKTKPKESMVLSDYALAAPFSTIHVSAPQVRPMLKRIVEDIRKPPSHPSKKVKRVFLAKKTKVLARDSGEEDVNSLGVGPQVGPVAPKATPLAIVVEVTSSKMLSDPMASHLVDLNLGRPSLQEELNVPFPPKASTSTSIAPYPIGSP